MSSDAISVLLVNGFTGVGIAGLDNEGLDNDGLTAHFADSANQRNAPP